MSLKLFIPDYPAEILREWYAFPENIVRVTAGPGGEALLILGSEKTALIDTGMACFAGGLIANLHIVLGARPLDYIFCTHSHYDHVGALSAVKKEWPQAVTCASAYAKKVFSRPGAIKTMQEMTLNADRTYPGADPHAMIDFDLMQIERVLSDGDRISLGDESILVIETPGHTNCSLSYALEPQRILFLSESTGVLNEHNKVESSVLKTYDQTYESIRKCRTYGASRMISPHAGMIPEYLHDEYWRLLEEDMEYFVDFVAQSRDRMSEEEMLDTFVRETYKISKGSTQPLPAFRLNGLYQLRAAAQELERRG